MYIEIVGTEEERIALGLKLIQGKAGERIVLPELDLTGLAGAPVQSAKPKPNPPEWPKTNDNGIKVDAKGIPFDPLEHHQSQVCNADGSWKRKPGRRKQAPTPVPAPAKTPAAATTPDPSRRSPGQPPDSPIVRRYAAAGQGAARQGEAAARQGEAAARQGEAAARQGEAAARQGL